MEAIEHRSNNDVLRAPSGVAAEDCYALPITRVTSALAGGEQMPGVVSYWMPTPAELALLNAGNAVRFCCWGRTHPPMMIGVDGDGWL